MADEPDTNTDTAPAKGKLKLTADAAPAAPPPGHVLVRVTKAGHRKIHKGGTTRSGDEGTPAVFNAERLADPEDDYEVFPTWRWKDEFFLPLRIAKRQENNGNLEVLDEDA